MFIWWWTMAFGGHIATQWPQRLQFSSLAKTSVFPSFWVKQRKQMEAQSPHSLHLSLSIETQFMLHALQLAPRLVCRVDDKTNIAGAPEIS